MAHLARNGSICYCYAVPCAKLYLLHPPSGENGELADERRIEIVEREGETLAYRKQNNLSYVGTKPLDALMHVIEGARLDLVGASKNRVYAESEIRTLYRGGGYGRADHL